MIDFASDGALTIRGFAVTKASFAGEARGGTLTLDVGAKAVGSIHLTGGEHRGASFSLTQAIGSNGTESVIRLG